MKRFMPACWNLISRWGNLFCYIAFSLLTPQSGLAGKVKIMGLDSQADDRFGIAMAADGNYLLVGAENHDSDGLDGGAAYLYKRHSEGDNSWGQVAKLTANDSVNLKQFGHSVAIDGNYLVVGAPSATHNGITTGAAYVFAQTQPDQWTLAVKLVSDSPQDNDQFGISVGISGYTIVVGAENHDPDGLVNAGSAFVFQHQPDTNLWSQTAMLTANDKVSQDKFGSGVAIDGDVMAVGARLKDAVIVEDKSPRSLLTPRPKFIFARIEAGPCPEETGAIYVFQRSAPGANWQQLGLIIASDSECGDQFGQRIALHNGTLVAGIPSKDLANELAAGAVYVYSAQGG